MNAKTVYEALKFYSECKAHDPGGVLAHFWPLYYVEVTLQKQGLSGQALKDRVMKCFKRLLQKWGESDPDRAISQFDIYWLVLITIHMKIADLIWMPLFQWRINEDYQGFTERVKQLNITNLRPVDLAALILSSPNNLSFPPGHLLWLARGVNHKGEWRELGAKRVIKTVTNLEGINTAFVVALRRAFGRQGASDKMKYGPEYTGPKPSAEDELTYLSDTDRLSQFRELAGIDMDTLTDGESNRVLDILRALDMGYDFASKQGVSLQAYYGDRGDSEKTQRQRLFKKIKEASDKAK